MNSRTSIAVTAAAMLLSASLVMAQASTPGSGSAYSGTRSASGAMTKTRAATGAAVTTSKGSTAGTAATSATGAAQAAAGGLVDLNTASKADLMKLPGVGEAISAKIIAGRPWASKAQLVSRGLVSKPVYARLSGMVIAKQAGKQK